MMENYEFMECDTCRAKLGTPDLCKGCLQNRHAITILLEKSVKDAAEKQKCRERVLEADARVGQVERSLVKGPPKKPTRTVGELVNLIVDIQISLAANPPMDSRHDGRFSHRAALLQELVFAVDRDGEMITTGLLQELVFAVDRDGEMITTEDVAKLRNEQWNSLAQRVYELEQHIYKTKKKSTKPPANG